MRTLLLTLTLTSTAFASDATWVASARVCIARMEARSPGDKGFITEDGQARLLATKDGNYIFEECMAEHHETTEDAPK